MAPNAPGPYWVQLNYTSPDSPHTMQISTKDWSAGAGAGSFEIWSGGTIPASTMVADFVTLLLPLFNSDVTFNNFVVFKQLLPADDPQPVASGSFTGQVGTNTDGSWARAVEKIFTARSSSFGIAKLDLLDVCSQDVWNPRTSYLTAEADLLAEWASDGRGWAARDNGQVTTFLKVTTNLNQALRKAYRMT